MCSFWSTAELSRLIFPETASFRENPFYPPLPLLESQLLPVFFTRPPAGRLVHRAERVYTPGMSESPRLTWEFLTLELKNPFRVAYGVSETRQAGWLRLAGDAGWGEGDQWGIDGRRPLL